MGCATPPGAPGRPRLRFGASRARPWALREAGRASGALSVWSPRAGAIASRRLCRSGAPTETGATQACAMRSVLHPLTARYIRLLRATLQPLTARYAPACLRHAERVARRAAAERDALRALHVTKLGQRTTAATTAAAHAAHTCRARACRHHSHLDQPGRSTAANSATLGEHPSAAAASLRHPGGGGSPLGPKGVAPSRQVGLWCGGPGHLWQCSRAAASGFPPRPSPRRSSWPDMAHLPQGVTTSERDGPGSGCGLGAEGAVCRAWVRTTGEHITQTLSLPGPGLAPINHGTVHAGGMQSI
eukprot:scaffold41218_cov58-Phaeocystis_antarctica.AAC.5